MRKQILFLLCLCLLLTCSVTSCAGSERSAEDSVRSVLALWEEVPDGVLYRAGAERGDVGYLSEADFDLLYGAGAAAYELPLVRDYAIYLSSFALPFEVAVFRCYERSDADRLGALLLTRADALKVSLKQCGLYGRYGERICVAVSGEYAVLVMAESVPDTAKITRAIRP